MIIEDLIEINRRLSHDLWNVSFIGEEPSGLSPRLIFPKKRIKNKKNEDVKRISEQEARILYCNILNNLNYFYSIETPTNEAYKLTGKTGVSALSDLSVYSYTRKDNVNNSKNNEEKIFFKKMANIELKAHNPAEENICKDIEKIITEGIDGNWFHILKNIDSGTLPSVIKKIYNSIKINFLKNEKISILFCICILEKKWGMIKHLEYDSSLGKNISTNIEEFFCMDKNNKLNNIDGKNLEAQKDILKNNGWMIVEQ